MVSALIVVAAQCMAPEVGFHACRTVHVKVLVDPAIAQNPSWKTAVAELFDKTSGTMRACANVTLHVDTLSLWNIEKSPSYKDLLIGDCLMKEQPKGRQDLIVYFGTSGSPPPMTEAMALYEQGYAFIRQPVSFDAKTIDTQTYLSLVHWTAHMFGAVHCYFNKSNVTIMNPYIHDGTMLDIGAAGGEPEPKFHKGNSQIMTALARRPFDESGWSVRRWAPIMKIYEEVRNKYNPWRIDENGLVANYQSDAFHEGNLFMCLSSWASLCGMPDKALGYLDSVEHLVTAMEKTCIKKGVAGSTRICTMCGYDTSTINTWVQTRMFTLQLRRTRVLLRAGALDSATTCFNRAMARIPPQLTMLKDKYSNGFAFYKARYAPKTPASSRSAK